MGSEGYHEPVEWLDPAVITRHRAIQSLMEELEAVDWYDQRIAATDDAELVAILEHNRDEEKEHAAMVLEWLRRADPGVDAALRTYLFTEGPIVALEAAAESGGGDGGGAGAGTPPIGGGDRSGPGRSLGIGSLREVG